MKLGGLRCISDGGGAKACLGFEICIFSWAFFQLKTFCRTYLAKDFGRVCFRVDEKRGYLRATYA